jgi:hypothetical protein
MLRNRELIGFMVLSGLSSLDFSAELLGSPALNIAALIGIAALLFVSEWLAIRSLAVAHLGQGRPWKWAFCLIGLGALIEAVHWLFHKLIELAGVDDIHGVVATLVSSLFGVVLLLAWVRICSLAVSGDRIDFDRIARRLRPHLIPFMAALAFALAVSFATLPLSIWVPEPYYWIALGGGAFAIAIASGLSTAVIVTAFLFVANSADGTEQSP